jgi:hypothetical protein
MISALIKTQRGNGFRVCVRVGTDSTERIWNQQPIEPTAFGNGGDNTVSRKDGQMAAESLKGESHVGTSSGNR